ncbi:MAG: hypothetical protein NZ927_07615 [Candidatus Calescibacterium sp.]|nr:hypothetical protein [Candidatus Calescibacterium sp.]MCX7734724.1 hypothetical protein [bacterium]MDW8087294.1 hypothetical protein [Candidatus Calescibacterium sp.]
MKKIIASFLGGTIASVLNTIVEYISDTNEFYRVEGSHKILSTPAIFFVLWIFLAGIYALGSFRVRNIFLYIVIGIIGGWILDFLGWKLGILVIEEKGNPIINATVWLVLVPTTVLLSHLFNKIFSKS